MLNAERVKYNQVLDRIEQKPIKSNHVIRYFPDTFLGNGHEGLASIAEKAGINIRKLNPGEFLIFVNKAQTGLKLYAPGNIVAYLKMPGSQRINPRVITMIPRFFNGTEINYNGALREAFKKYYSPRLVS